MTGTASCDVPEAYATRPGRAVTESGPQRHPRVPAPSLFEGNSFEKTKERRMIGKSRWMVGLALALAACGSDNMAAPGKPDAGSTNPPPDAGGTTASIKVATSATLGTDYLV